MADNIARGMAASAMAYGQQVAGDLSNIDASLVPYDNQTSGLTADDTQSAIDELKNEAFVIYTDGGTLVEDFEDAGKTIDYTLGGGFTRAITGGYNSSGCLDSTWKIQNETDVVTINFTMPNDGIVSWWWKRQVEYSLYCGNAQVKLDGELVANEYNIAEWTKKEVSVTAGTHTLVFYGGVNVNGNWLSRLWIDNLSIPAPRIYNQSIFEHDDLDNFVGNGGKALALKSDETGIEFKELGDALKILTKPISISDFTGKDGYVLAYNETEGEFYLKADEGGGGGSLLSVRTDSKIGVSSLSFEVSVSEYAYPV